MSSIDETNLQIVYFDLETTDINNPDIIQIAASYNNNVFNAYILPTQAINPGASAVNGLTVVGGELFLRDQRVAITPTQDAFLNFLEFLKNTDKPVVLVAHNGFRFDVPILIRYFKQLNLFDDFAQIIYGFADSLKILRRKLETRVKKRRSFKLTELARDLLNEPNFAGAHNAIQDTLMLERVLNAADVRHQEIFENIKTIREYN